MSRLAYFSSGKISRFYHRIHEVAKENGKSTPLMLADLVYCSFRYGAGLSDYVNFRFYDMNAKERKTYVTVLDCDRFYAKLSPAKYKTFFTVKPNFLRNFSAYINRDYCTYAMGYEKFRAFLEKNEMFMLKPIDGLGGHGVIKCRASEITDPEAFFEAMEKDGTFAEGFVIQHEDMGRLCPNSVNTIRVMTYANAGKSRIFYAAVRMGTGADVDNFHQGGIGCQIDPATGRMVGKAIDKENREYEEHPVSHIRFDGYQIPHWDIVQKITKEAALVNPNIHVVGWDVAVLPDGATFIEGNRRPGWDLVQSLDHRGSKFRMDEILRQYKDDEKAKKKQNR